LTDYRFVQESGRHGMHARMLDYVDPGNGKKVLELGCGPGKYAALLHTAGFDVEAVDPHEFDTWERIRASTSVRLTSEVYAENLPYGDASFDHVTCLSALLYFQDPFGGLSQMYRVLRPGGLLVLRTVNSGNLYTARTGKKLDPASKQLYRMEELISLVESAGFAVEDSFAYGFWPPFLSGLWWYLSCVWMNNRWEDRLSNMLRPEHRVNNIVIARKPGAS